MLEVVLFKSEHMTALNVQNAQKNTAKHFTPELAKHLEGEHSFTVMCDGKPIGCVGLFAAHANKAELWSYIDQQSKKCFVAGFRVANRLLEVAPFKRIEIYVLHNFEQGHRLARMLGFEIEAPLVRAYFPEGEDATLYSRIKYMAVPVLIAMVVASAAMSAASAAQQAHAASSAAKYNQQVAEQNATLAQQQGQAAQLEQARQSTLKQGQMVAAYGASGVSASSGSPLDQLNDSIRQSTLDNLTVGYNAQIKALGYQNQATLDGYQSSADTTSGYLNAAGSIFGGGAKAMSMGLYPSGSGSGSGTGVPIDSSNSGN